MNPEDIDWSTKKSAKQEAKEDLHEMIDIYTNAIENNDEKTAKETLDELKDIIEVLTISLDVYKAVNLPLNTDFYQFKLKGTNGFTFLDEDEVREMEKKRKRSNHATN